MRVLVVTFYYQPDLSAGAFRTRAFVRALAEALPEGSTVDVLTTLPNRYHSFSAEALEFEEQEGVSILRTALPPHQSGMVDQVKAFRVFAWSVLRTIKGRQYDLVYATSSRMATGFLGAVCARFLKTRFYLDVRDIFNENITEVLGGTAILLLLPLLNAIERFTVGTAAKVNLVSRGFLPYFQRRYPKQAFSVFPNGIDDQFLNTDFTRRPHVEQSSTKRVVCAGNIGQGQGLHRIVPQLASRVRDAGFHFEIIGAGGALHLLEEALEKAGLDNVTLSPPVPRVELVERYRQADVLFLHLNDFDAFRNVLPSKIFEYAATGKPILAGVAGYAAEFLDQEVVNVAVVPPCSIEAAAKALRELSLETTDRQEFIQRFRRDNIMRRLVDDCLSLSAPPT